MSLLSENLRHLRAQKKCAQQHVANDLIISRGRYSKYEDGKSEPPLEILKRISVYYQLSIDLIVSVDLRKIEMQDLMALRKTGSCGRSCSTSENRIYSRLSLILGDR